MLQYVGHPIAPNLWFPLILILEFSFILALVSHTSIPEEVFINVSRDIETGQIESGADFPDFSVPGTPRTNTGPGLSP